jgi:hypothetical protein
MDPDPSRPGSPETPARKAVEPDMADDAVRQRHSCFERGRPFPEVCRRHAGGCPGWSAGLSACFRAANQVKTNWWHCLRRPLTKSKRFPEWSTQRPRSCEFA